MSNIAALAKLNAGDLRVAVEHPPLLVVSAEDLLTRQFPPREMVLAPIIPQKGLVMLYGARGVGKTHGALGIAYAVATGGQFLRWKAPKPRKVLYVDGEMPGELLQERLRAMANPSGVGKPLEPGHIRFLVQDLQERELPDLATVEGQAAVDRVIDDAELVIVDNISTLVRNGKENEAEGWGPVQAWALGLRRRGISVLFIHHAGKGGQQRGTSRREDVLDTVVNLRKPESYVPSDGARFEVHIEKGRRIYGDEASPFEAKLEVRDGSATWSMKAVESSVLIEVVNLTKGGLPQREIAKKLGVGVATVNRRVQEARVQGLLPPSGDQEEDEVEAAAG